jgi:hypothetical protein
MAISTLVVLSGLRVGKTTFPDVCLPPMWFARVKLETAAMTKNFALKRKFFDGAHHYAGTVFNFHTRFKQYRWLFSASNAP